MSEVQKRPLKVAHFTTALFGDTPI